MAFGGMEVIYHLHKRKLYTAFPVIPPPIPEIAIQWCIAWKTWPVLRDLQWCMCPSFRRGCLAIQFWSMWGEAHGFLPTGTPVQTKIEYSDGWASAVAGFMNGKRLGQSESLFLLAWTPLSRRFSHSQGPLFQVGVFWSFVLRGLSL